MELKEYRRNYMRAYRKGLRYSVKADINLIKRAIEAEASKLIDVGLESSYNKIIDILNETNLEENFL